MLYNKLFPRLSSAVCFSKARELFTLRRSQTSPRSPLTSNLSLPLLCFFISEEESERGSGKARVNSPNRNESYEGDVTLNESPHHGMTYIYTTPEGNESSDVSPLCVSVCAFRSVFLGAATPCQIESVPTPQAWGNTETSLPFCSLFSSSFHSTF